MSVIADDYPLDYLKCRSHGHPWDFIGYFRMEGFLNHIVQESMCLRCGLQRETELSADGEKRIAAYYRYPHGYQLQPGTSPPKAEFRRTLVSRIPVYESAADLHAAQQDGVV